MRLKFVITTFIFSLFSLINASYLSAQCLPPPDPGPCSGPCGTQEVTFLGQLNYSTDKNCPSSPDGPAQCAVYNCNDNGICSDPNDPYNYNPVGSVCCDKPDCFNCTTTGGNCIYETADVLCNCSPTPTPGGGGGGGGGGSGEPTPPPATPTTSLIQGSVHLDTDASLSGNYCFQADSSPLSLTGWTLNASKDANTYNASFLYISPNTYSINTATTGTGYTVSLDLSGQVDTNYVCSCPAPANPNNPYLCRYTGVTSPTANVNFYLREYNLSNNSWFQVFGSNYFAYNLISSPVPATTCEDDPDCVAALAAPNVDQNNPLSAGFPVVNTSNSNSVRSSASSSVYHAYFHPATRPSNLNSYALSTELAPLSYEYFYQLAETSLTEIGNGEDLEPLLSDFTSAPWWQTNEVNYVKINGNVSIDETQGFQLGSGQQLVVFVDGRLTFDDSNPNDTNRKITSVANGGFLAFIASGDIWITPNVGYELNPSVPTVPAVTVANSNLEGVFIAANDLLLQSKSAIGETPPDRKFIGAGTFIGWNNVLLNRTFNDGGFGPILNNNQAVENFIYRPDLLVNWPVKLKASTSTWREVDPQLITQ